MVQGLPVLSHTLGRKVREGLDVGQFLTRWFARPCVREIVPTSFFICLGFKRPDPLYRIKSNERKITLALAVRILRNWPQFNLGWLLTGQGPVRLEVGPASGEGNLSPLSGDAVSPQRKFGAPPTAESIVGRWELTHAFSLVDEWQSDGQPDATFACNEIVWDFGPDRIVVFRCVR